MRFPTGSEVTKLRTRQGQRSKIYLGVQQGKERTCGSVFNVGCHYQIVAADAYDNDDYYLDFNVITLVGSGIRPGMTLAVGTLTDPFLYGSARIRVVDAANQRLYLEPNNLNDEGYFVAGDYVYVDGVYRLYRILPYIEGGLVYEDGNADSLEPGAPSLDHGIIWAATYYNRPVALMGSPRPAFAGEAIPFYGWRSHGRGGRSIQNWTWDFDSGVCEGPDIGFPGSPAVPIMARWDEAGEYVASLVVEDDSGNAGNDAYGVQFNRHRAVRPVLVFDRPGRGDNPPYMNFEVSSLTGRYGSGWSCRITVFGTADKSEFPDNALIILFCEDWYDDALGSIGGWYGQENILFVGHIRADSVEVDSEKSTVSFEANTIEQWMSEIDVWPANFSDPTDAQNAWHEYDDMTIEDCLWHLAEVHSNLKDVTDVFFASDVNAEKDVDFLDLTEADLYDQMSSQIGSCFFGQLSASRHGSVHLAKHKNMLDLAERVWWGPPVYSFSRQDWRDELQIGEERQRDSVAQVDFIGFVYDAAGNPLESYSLAPERQTNFGGIEKVSGILLSGNTVGPGTPSQAESNTLAGLYRAWKNIRFPHVRVPAFNNRILESATLDYFAVVLEETDTIRGYDWAGKEFLTTGVSVNVDTEKGIILTEIEGEASTWGPDGVAGPYPPTPPTADPPNDNPSEYWPDWATAVAADPPPWATGDDIAPAVAYFVDGTSGRVFRCTDYFGEPVYEDLGVVDAGGLHWFALDEFDRQNKAMVCGAAGVWSTTNLASPAPDWTLEIALPGGWDYFSQVRSSPVQDGVWQAVAVRIGNDLGVWWTTTDGTVWGSDLSVEGAWIPDEAHPYLELSSHNVNKSWISWGRWGDGGHRQTYTDDMWATSTASVAAVHCIGKATWSTYDHYPSHHRYMDNDDDLIAIWGGVGATLGDEEVRIKYATAGFADAAAACTVLCAHASEQYLTAREVGCFKGSPNRWWALVWCGEDVFQRFYISNDGIIWTLQHTFTIASPGDVFHAADSPVSQDIFVATHDGAVFPLWLSIDRGVDWTAKVGNWGDLGRTGDLRCVAVVI